MTALLSPPGRAHAAEIGPVPAAVRARMEGVSWHGSDPRCPAIDINPPENPWRRPDRILPAAGQAFADRRAIRPGMIVRPGPVVAALDELGWEWGGDWRHAFDDHHVVWSRGM